MIECAVLTDDDDHVLDRRRRPRRGRFDGVRCGGARHTDGKLKEGGGYKSGSDVHADPYQRCVHGHGFSLMNAVNWKIARVKNLCEGFFTAGRDVAPPLRIINGYALAPDNPGQTALTKDGRGPSNAPASRQAMLL